MSGEEFLEASARGYLDEVNRLLSNGADVNHKDKVYILYYNVMCSVSIILIVIYYRGDIHR
jgi:hypothetical protein